MNAKTFSVGAATVLIAAVSGAVGAAEARIDVSRIIDKAEAASILGEAVKDTTPRNMDGQDGYYSKCNYYTVKPGKRLIIRVRQAAPGSIDPQQELEMVRASTGDTTKVVSGLGDKAEFSHGEGSDLRVHVIILYVIKGNAFITVGLGGLDDDSLALEKAKSVAQKIIGHL